MNTHRPPCSHRCEKCGHEADLIPLHDYLGVNWFYRCPVCTGDMIHSVPVDIDQPGNKAVHIMEEVKDGRYQTDRN